MGCMGAWGRMGGKVHGDAWSATYGAHWQKGFQDFYGRHQPADGGCEEEG